MLSIRQREKQSVNLVVRRIPSIETHDTWPGSGGALLQHQDRLISHPRAAAAPSGQVMHYGLKPASN